MPAQKSGPTLDMTWSRWYYVTRDEMAFRYGWKRVPVDTYKEQFALGLTPQQAARAIYQKLGPRP